MRQIVRTLLISLCSLILAITTISSIYLAFEKKKLSEQYNKDRELWDLRNKTLRGILDRSEEGIKNLKEELAKLTVELENSSRQMGDLKTGYEDLKKENVSLNARVNDYSQEKQKLLTQISKLTKDLKQSEEVRKAKEDQEEFWPRILREKADLEYRVRELEEKLKSNRSLLTQLEGERKSLEASLNDIQLEKMNIEKGLLSDKGTKPASGSPRDVLKKRIEKENMEGQLTDLASRKDELEAKINALKSDVEKADSEKQSLVGEIGRVNQLLGDRLNEVNRVRQELEMALSQAKQIALSGSSSSVELPPIVVKKEEIGKASLSDSVRNTDAPYPTTVKFIPPTTKNAEVVLVNEKNEFVILNIGKIHGVTEGMNFDIYDGEVNIGSVKVKEARERLAAAQMIKVSPGKRIKNGATAKYSP